MPDKGYNGWSNRATWNVNLWLSNDQGLYNEVNRLERRHVDDLSGDVYDAEEAVEEARDSLEEAKKNADALDQTNRTVREADDASSTVLALTLALTDAESQLATAKAEKPDLEDFAEAIQKFCADLWPNGLTPDGAKLTEADFDEIAAAWVDP